MVNRRALIEPDASGNRPEDHPAHAPPALSPEAQRQIIIQAATISSEDTGGLQGGTAEKHRRLGDVVEALDGKS